MTENKLNYFVWLNRILTNLLSGLIAIGASLGVFYGALTILKINLAGFTNLNFLLFVVISLSIFVANLVFQFLQNYFCHLLEKEKYNQFGRKFFYNFSGNAIATMLTITLGFLVYSQSQSAGIWALTAQLVFGFILGSIIRENSQARLVFANMLGNLIGIFIVAILILVSIKQNLGLAIIVGNLGLVLIPIISSCFEFVSEVFAASNEPEVETNSEIPA
jgi:hypothetical protein